MNHTNSFLLTPLLLAFTASRVDAQLVFISDLEVRTAYNEWVPGCVDVNGYLDPAFTGVATYDPDQALLANIGPSTIEGLDAFTAVHHLAINSSGDIVLGSLPPALEKLAFLFAGEITLPTTPPTLRSLVFSGCSGPLPPLPEGIQEVDIESMPQLTTVGLLPSTLLKLTLIDLPGLTVFPAFPMALQVLSIGAPINLPFPDLTGLNLLSLEVYSMPYTSLPSLPSSLETLRLIYLGDLQTFSLPTGLDTLWVNDLYSCDFPQVLPDLKYLFMGGMNDMDGADPMPQLPTTLQDLVLSDCPILNPPALPEGLLSLNLINGSSLTCLSPLPEGLQELHLDQTLITCLPNIPPGCLITGLGMTPTVCATLSGICPAASANVEGQVFRDVDQDGVQDVGEPASNYLQLSIAPIGLAGGVPTDGHFMVQLPPGNYTISGTPSSPFVQGFAPVSHTAILADEASMDTDNDFGLDLIVGNDLAVNIATSVASPGRDNAVWINVRNLGTEVMDASVSYTFDADQAWVSSDVSTASLIGNTASWVLPGMLMGEMRTIHVTLHTDALVALGTALDQAATVDVPPGDVNVSNNSALHNDEVLGSYDPNDKTVSPSVIGSDELAAAEFTYTIRFQNTGTYHAERVIITDTLSASLDWNSFRFVASSHTCNWTLFNGVLRFTFDPIFLPDSTSDEPGSHGVVTFTMKPDPSAGLGPIGNVANIYFDYNAPVFTNEALVDISTNVNAPAEQHAHLFPVPAQDVLWVDGLPSGGALVTVVDMQGRMVLTQRAGGSLLRLDVGPLPAGVYVLESRSGTTERLRFVKR